MVHLLLRQHQEEENAGRVMMRKMLTMMMREGRGVKLVTTKRVRRRIAIEDAVLMKRKRMKKVETERGVKFVTTIGVRRKIAIENAEKRKMIRQVETERGVKFVTTKWVRKWIAIGNAVLPAMMKMMPNVIGNGAMHATLVMTITILFIVLSVIDKKFYAVIN